MAEGKPADRRHYGMYIGEVVANDDPKALGRVRVKINGLISPYSAWAWPLGTGGGNKDRGHFKPPSLHSEVAVWFKEGDIDYPWYLGANWGEGEVPEPARSAGNEAFKVGVLETDTWKVVYDDRPGVNSILSVENKVTGDKIEFDGNTAGITVEGKAAVVIKAIGVVSIEGGQVVINGRVVAPSPDPI